MSNTMDIRSNALLNDVMPANFLSKPDGISLVTKTELVGS